MISLTTTYTNEKQRSWGSGAKQYTPATTREKTDRFTIADANEVTVATDVTAARFLRVENLSSTADNTLSVGFATGTYINEIPPGQTGIIWIVGKPNNPTLYFKFVNAGGGDVEYVLRD